MRVYKNKLPAGYFPVMMGNGALSIYLDYCGRQGAEGAYDFKRRIVPDGCVWWEGRRYEGTPHAEGFNTRSYCLIPFGYMNDIINGEYAIEPSDWWQELDTDNFVMRSSATFEFGNIDTEAYVHTDYNLISMTKTFGGQVEYSFVYKMEKPGGKPIKDFNYITRNIKNGIAIDYSVSGVREYKGEIRIFFDRPMKFIRNGDQLVFGGKFEAGEKLRISVLYCDDYDCDDYIQFLHEKQEKLLACPEAEFEAHCEKCRKYMAQSSISVSDEKINCAYKTAQYHLKALSSKWSIPMGICDACWHGRYFAFDEVFLVLGLLGSHRFDEVRKILEFRYNGLKAAEYNVGNAAKKQACYSCTVLENGEPAHVVEAYWELHIFQNTSIAVNFWEYYLFTGDSDFLREKGAPVIESCAHYFVNNMVYRIKGVKTFVGNCTDLERLGPSICGAYMTTCSVIKMLEIYKNITDLFDIDRDFGNLCAEIASELRDSLPNDGEKYIPYEGCKDKSIAVFAGCFPYCVQPKDDQMQRKAIDDFVKSELTFGNMYTVGSGKHISPWYAAWKGEAYAYLHVDEVYSSLQQANASTGCFGEMFEINEPNCMFRPWFTTASGSYIHAANAMMAQYEDEKLYILPAFPESEKTLSFKVAVHDAMTVSAEICDGRMTSFHIEFEKDRHDVEVVIPRHIDVSSIPQLSEGKNGNYIYRS